MKGTSKLLSLLFLCWGCCVQSAQLGHRANLTKNLLLNYDPSVVPTTSQGSPLEVAYEFTLSSIDNLDEKNQVMVSYGWIILSWYDVFLTWDPADYGGIYNLVIPAKKIWLPEMVLKNGVDEGVDLALNSDFRVSIMYDGSVTWIPSYRWTTSCTVDLTIFPLDTQVCSVVFMAWLTPISNDMKFVPSEPSKNRTSSTSTTPVLTGLYSENEQWALTDSHSWDFAGGVAVGQDYNSTITVAAFTVQLTRQPLYYIVNLIIPSLAINLMAMFIFYLPIESGEKVSFGITMLLSYTLLLLMINDITPRGGPKVPLLSYYVTMGMMMCVLSLVITFKIMKLYNTSDDKPIPSWAKRILCFHDNKVQDAWPTKEDVKNKEKDPAPTDEGSVADNQWIKFARRIDLICFIFSLVFFAVVSLVFFFYIHACTKGHSTCLTRFPGIFHATKMFQV